MPHITLLMTLDEEREESEEEGEALGGGGRITPALRFQGKSQVENRACQNLTNAQFGV